MPSIVWNGAPGDTYTNRTDKCLFQLVVNWSNSCGVCISYDHAVGYSWPIPFHHSCRCKQILLPPGAESQPFVDYRAKVLELPPTERSRVMGASNLKLVEAGVVDWKDVVTEGRVRDLREVVSLRRLSVDAMVKAGVPRKNAEDAYRTVNTAAHDLAAETRRRVAEALKARGLGEQEIKRLVGERLAARVTVGGDSAGPPPAPRPPKPTPLPTPAPKVAPLTAEQIGKALGITIKPAPTPEPARPVFVPARTVAEAKAKARELGVDVRHRPEDVLELMADRFEAARGWTDGRTREGFVKNWKKRLKGSAPSDEVLLEALNGINGAVHDGRARPWPTVVRKPVADHNEDFIAGRYMPGDDYLIIYDNGDAKRDHKPADVRKKLTDVPSSYASDWEGTYVHEFGHHLTIVERPDVVKRAEAALRDLTPERKARIKELVSNYATSNGLELAAEAYTLRQHPEFSARSPESQEFVKMILGEQ